MKSWNDLIMTATPLVNYLNRQVYFNKRYSGSTLNKLVLIDPDIAFDYATNDSFDNFDEWESVSDSSEVFPEDFEWKSWIDHNLSKNNYFSIANADFDGADKKLTRFGVCILRELMHRDIRILLNCYANDYFPKIWTDILNVYLHDGFPCGWDGKHPDGRLVVFSNH